MIFKGKPSSVKNRKLRKRIRRYSRYTYTIEVYSKGESERFKFDEHLNERLIGIRFSCLNSWKCY